MAIQRVKPGIVTAQDGTYPELRGSRKGGAVTQDVAGRYEELAYRGNLYTITTAGGGVQLAATHLFSTAIASFTPLLALYNPLGNTKNFAVLAAGCGLSAAPLATVTQTGQFLYVVNAGQSISNAQTATPVNHFTFKASGSSGIGVTNAVLTGAVGNATVLKPIESQIELVTTTANASALTGGIVSLDVAGAIIVPPGAYLAFATGLSNAVAGHFVSAFLTYEEIAL